MPLCKLEVPTGSQLGPLSRDVKGGVLSTCDRVLDLTLTELKIPADDDREVSVVRAGLDKSRLVISYTVGPHEYPNYKPESFDPDKELVRKVGQQIHDEVSGKLGISHTRMEAWRDTTFAITPIKDKRNEPVPKEVKREIASNVKEPKITLFLSPELRQSGSSSTESERKSGDPFERVSDEVSSSIKETLGLPYVESEVVWAEFADSQVSIEFDCRVESGYRIPQEAREAAAESVEKALNQNVYTRDREAEIWIRQGSPEVETFNSE